MNDSEFILDAILPESAERRPEIARTFVLETSNDGSVLVAGRTNEDAAVRCDVLCTTASPPELACGDDVLVWIDEVDDRRGVVLGRIGPGKPASARPKRRHETPEELIIEATQNLTFKCGEGSITLRGDGKVLIKGKDLVSRAQCTNRIKGGSVAIN